MYIPMDALYLGLVGPHLRHLNGEAAAANNPPPPKMAFLDDLTETAFKVGVGTLGKHGERGYTGPAVPDGEFCSKAANYAHALSTHPAASAWLTSSTSWTASSAFFRARARVDGRDHSGANPVLFRAVATAELCGLPRRSIARASDSSAPRTSKERRRCGSRSQSAGDNRPPMRRLAQSHRQCAQRAAGADVFPHEPLGGRSTEFKFAESEKGVLLELVPGTSKVYTKVQIPLVKSGQSWVGPRRPLLPQAARPAV